MYIISEPGLTLGWTDGRRITDKQMRNAIDRRQKAFDTLLSCVLKQLQVPHQLPKPSTFLPL